jgi:flagellar protein FliO/FliZ
MMVRRFTATAALAVALIGNYAPNAWAHSRVFANGGATAPVALAASAGTHPLADTAAPHRRAAAKKFAVKAKHAAAARHTAAAHAKKPSNSEFAFENTPLHVPTTTHGTKTAATSTSGSSIIRTLLGLIFVAGLIYAIAWIMRRVKRGREAQATGNGLSSVATLPLGSGRTLHLVRAGSDVILVGSSEHGVAPVRVYSEEEALANGLISDDGQEDAMRAAAIGFAPEGASRPPTAGRAAAWRAVAPNETPADRVLGALRRMTVRS